MDGLRPTPPDQARASEPGGALWLEVRDHELREIERERALRLLLLDVSRVCARATDVDSVVRAVLVRVIMGLDAIEAWVALGPRGPVHDSRGPVGEPEAILALALTAQEGSGGDGAVRLDAAQTSGLPDGAAGHPALYVPFRLHGTGGGWLLLVADPVPADADGTLATIAAFLGVAVARTRAVQALRRLNRRLEKQVRRRTAELMREKESLEDRVRDRTAELERARLAAVDAERRMLDRERVEGVHQLAAGVAHELNNPLGALQGTLEFLRDELAGVGPGDSVAPDVLSELKDAVRDGISDIHRMTDLVASLFGQVAESRRAAVRTDLNAAVREALEHFRMATPGGRNLASNLGEGQTVGIPHAELTRWIFRLLTAVASSDPGGVHVRTGVDDEGRPALEVHLPIDCEDVPTDLLATLVKELHAAGVHTRVVTRKRTRVLHLSFPPGCGEPLWSRAPEAVR